MSQEVEVAVQGLVPAQNDTLPQLSVAEHLPRQMLDGNLARELNDIHLIPVGPWIREMQKTRERDADQPFTLKDIPDAAITQYKGHMLYLMGLWAVSDEAFAFQVDQALKGKYNDELPQLRRSLEVGDDKSSQQLAHENVTGSRFAIKGYFPDPENAANMQEVREFILRAHQLGVRICLDFIPNHFGIGVIDPRTYLDFYNLPHPDMLSDEEYRHLQTMSWEELMDHLFLRGSRGDGYTNIPGSSGDRFYAQGRDPYTGSWADTLQIKYADKFAQAMMQLVMNYVLQETHVDALRIDMAALPDMFTEVWGIDSQPFYPMVIAQIKRRFPHAALIPEAYWGFEKLNGFGFDAAYHHDLYQDLRRAINGDTIVSVAKHLLYMLEQFDPHDLCRLNYVENHDEERAAKVFGRQGAEVAAAMVALLPFPHMTHYGQEWGEVIKHSVQVKDVFHSYDDLAMRQLAQRLSDLRQEIVYRPGGVWSMAKLRNISADIIGKQVLFPDGTGYIILHNLHGNGSGVDVQLPLGVYVREVYGLRQGQNVDPNIISGIDEHNYMNFILDGHDTQILKFKWK